MSEKSWRLLITAVSGALIIAARRYKNENSSAGIGVAGWTMVLLIIEALST